MSYGILLPRVALGLSVAAHGAQNIFGAFGGHELAEQETVSRAAS